MKKPHKTKFRQQPLLLLVALVLICAMSAVVYWKWSHKVVIIKSDDGSAELHIESGALPKGIDIASISIQRVQTEADGHLAEYKLSPDGLIFSKPVDFVVSLPMAEQPAKNVSLVPVPSILTMSEDHKSIQTLATALAFDAGKGLVRASTEINHFSLIQVTSFVSARIDNPSDKLLREQFFFGARMTLDRTEVRIPIPDDADYAAYVHTFADWELHDGSFFSLTEFTKPDVIGDVPEELTPEVGTAGRPTYAVARIFFCAEPGVARIIYGSFSGGTFRHYLEDKQGKRTELKDPEENQSSTIEMTSRPFRCVAAEQEQITDPPKEPTEKVLLSKDSVLTRYGKFEIEITPSKSRVLVGEQFFVDVLITDASSPLIENLTPDRQAAYKIIWQASGQWSADSVFDRNEVEVDNTGMQHLGRLRFRLPLRCDEPGTGRVRFDAFIGKISSEDAEPLIPKVQRYGGTMVETGPIECESPVQEGEDQTEPIRFGVSPTTLVATHVVGTTSCPQLIGDLNLVGPDGATWTAMGIPPWLSIPSSGKLGVIPIRFNCQINNYDAHAEQATVTFTSNNQSAEVSFRMVIR